MLIAKSSSCAPLTSAASSLGSPPLGRAATLDVSERVHEALRANDEVEAIFCLKSRQGVLVAVGLIDLPRALDQVNGLVSRTLRHYGDSVRSLANEATRAAGVLMADSATHVVSGGVKTAWGWGTWPARKTLTMLMAPLYAFADPALLPTVKTTVAPEPSRANASP